MHIRLLVFIFILCPTSSLVQAIGLTDLFPWLVFNRFQPDERWKKEIEDTSNDEAALISTHELIKRAGFDYENYYALSNDGYITQLIRIVNPLADSSQLRYPPVLVQHGQTANSRNFVLQSNIQHWPMPWPSQGAWADISREASTVAAAESGATTNSTNKSKDESKTQKQDADLLSAVLPLATKQPSLAPDQQMSSSNRSLAFMLANQGYDVFLASNRGVDENNKGFLGKEAIKNMLAKRRSEQHLWNMTDGEFELMWKRTQASYWTYTLDDQIAHETPSQILTVLEVTGARKITLVGYSNTAMTTLAMLSIRPDIAQYVDATVSIAPVVYYSKLQGWFKWFAGEFMQIFPKAIDAELFLTDQLADLMRRIMVRVCKPLAIRYTLCKFIIDASFGSSQQFMTNLELPFFGHMFRPTSWKCMAQHLQIIRDHRLAKFDYGKQLNRKYYAGQDQPPAYNISQILGSVHVGLVSGELDSWANPATLDEIVATLPVKPSLDLRLKEYNHVDLTCAFDVDKRVNLPVLHYLNGRADECERQLKQQDNNNNNNNNNNIGNVDHFKDVDNNYNDDYSDDL